MDHFKPYGRILWFYFSGVKTENLNIYHVLYTENSCVTPYLSPAEKINGKALND